MTRRLMIVLGVLATTCVLAVRAQDRLPKVNPKNKGDIRRSEDKTNPKIKIEDAATQQERLKRQFDEFKQKLLVLAQRMENSTRPEDREKAKILRKAIEKASEEGVETALQLAYREAKSQRYVQEHRTTSGHPLREPEAARSPSATSWSCSSRTTAMPN